MANQQLQKQYEARVNALLKDIGGQGKDADWALVRALVHRAVHFAADQKAGEFCAVATLLSEMIGHAHAIMHTKENHGDQTQWH